MTPRVVYRRGFVISAANCDAARAILARQGFGPDSFSIPLVRTDQKDILREQISPVAYYVAYFSALDDVALGIVRRKLAHLGVEEIDDTFPNVLTTKQSSRSSLRHEFGIAIVVRAADRAAVIAPLALRYADANTRFLTTKLSVSGSAPVQAYADRWQVDRTFAPTLKALCDSFSKLEVWIWVTNREALAAVKVVFDRPEYKISDSASRTKARVRVINNKIEQLSVLTELGLKVIP